MLRDGRAELQRLAVGAGVAQNLAAVLLRRAGHFANRDDAGVAGFLRESSVDLLCRERHGIGSPLLLDVPRDGLVDRDLPAILIDLRRGDDVLGANRSRVDVERRGGDCPAYVYVGRVGVVGLADGECLARGVDGAGADGPVPSGVGLERESAVSDGDAGRDRLARNRPRQYLAAGERDIAVRARDGCHRQAIAAVEGNVALAVADNDAAEFVAGIFKRDGAAREVGRPHVVEARVEDDGAGLRDGIHARVEGEPARVGGGGHDDVVGLPDGDGALAVGDGDRPEFVAVVAQRDGAGGERGLARLDLLGLGDGARTGVDLKRGGLDALCVREARPGRCQNDLLAAVAVRAARGIGQHFGDGDFLVGSARQRSDFNRRVVGCVGHDDLLARNVRRHNGGVREGDLVAFDLDLAAGGENL